MRNEQKEHYQGNAKKRRKKVSHHFCLLFICDSLVLLLSKHCFYIVENVFLYAYLTLYYIEKENHDIICLTRYYLLNTFD